MNTSHLKRTLMPLAAVLLVLPVLSADAATYQPGSVELVQPNAVEIVQPDATSQQVIVLSEEAIGGPLPAAATCCPAPNIIYRERGRCRKACGGCEPPIETALTVPQPRCCDTYFEIPICLPGCCKSAPSVKSRRGLFCNGVVVYRWCCGHKVTVVFKKCGDVIVTSYRA